jgi:hypothetical protein
MRSTKPERMTEVARDACFQNWLSAWQAYLNTGIVNPRSIPRDLLSDPIAGDPERVGSGCFDDDAVRAFCADDAPADISNSSPMLNPRRLAMLTPRPRR